MICEFYVLFLRVSKGEFQFVSHRNPLFELQGGATLLDEVQQVSGCYDIEQKSQTS